jgi:BlaI family transcriptional regulator, penicillinase repressor
MPRTARDVPPPLELLCLRSLWSLGEGNVKDVQLIVTETRPLAYTTIMTVLDRLVRKGKVSRRKVGRAFVYKPEASRDEMRRTAITELLDGFFDGSESGLIAFLKQPERAVAVAAGSEERQVIDPVLL